MQKTLKNVASPCKANNPKTYSLMKNKILFTGLFFTFLLMFSDLAAQVSISADNSNPHPSAMLDVLSADKGFLPPRVALTALDMAAPIALPATGLLVYNTAVSGTPPVDVIPGYYFWNGTRWVAVNIPDGVAAGNLLTWNGIAWVMLPPGEFGQQLHFCDGKPTWGGCLPIVNTTNPTNISSTVVTAGGIVVAEGGSPVTERGVCWSLTPNPTINDAKTIDGDGNGSFISYLTGLTPNTPYYLRAFATNSKGTSYGIETSFTTTAFPVAPHTIVPVISCPNDTLVIPVRVVSFYEIGAISLTLNYDSTVLEYIDGENTSGYPGLQIGGMPGTLTAGGYSTPGVSLPDSAILFTVRFVYHGGFSPLIWNTTPGACEYLDGNLQVMNDVPFYHFYMDGIIDQFNGVTTPVFDNGSSSSRCQEAGSLTYHATASNFTYLDYTLDQASFNAGNTIDKQTGEVNFIAGWSGTSEITAHAGGCGGPKSATHTVTILPKVNVEVSITASPFPVFPGDTVTLTANPLHGGTNPVFEWRVNGNVVPGNGASLKYLPSNHDQVFCVMTSNSTDCIMGNPATSNTVTLDFQDGPKTIAPLMTRCQGDIIEIPVKVTDFTDIGAISLTLDYNPSALSFISATNTSGYPNLMINGSIPGTVVIGGFASPGVSYPDTAILATLTFNYLGGITALQWNDNGSSCEYQNGAYKTLNDVPFAAFYYNGHVDGLPLVGIPVFTAGSSSTRCQGPGVVAYPATAVNSTGMVYHLCAVGLAGGNTIDSITGEVTFNPTWSGSLNVTAIAYGCGGPQSAAHTVTVNPPVTVGVSIAASSNPLCAGTSVLFTATPINGGTTPVYQWKVNGNNVGTNAPTYSYVPVNNDIVTCILTSNAPCSTGSPATSNAITVIVNPSLPVSVTVAASANPVCSGTQVTFTATPVNGGTTPVYQWKVNGNNVGTSSPTFAYVPVNGDNVKCVVTSSLLCVTGNPATSNTVVMTVNPQLVASVSIVASANPVPPSTSVTYTATPVNGGTTPSYQWKVNGANVGTNSPTYTYTPNNNDAVQVVMTTSITTCITGSPASSNIITMSVVPGVPCPGVPTVTHGGKVYNTVLIGTQCWFKENLDIGNMINSSTAQTNNSVIEKYCYNNDAANCAVYGGLYQWNEMMQYVTTAGAQGICPTGWHIPTETEFLALADYLGGYLAAGGKLKETGTTHWLTPNYGATNTTGFTAIPGGYYYASNNTFTYITRYTYYWSSTQETANDAWFRSIGYFSTSFGRYQSYKTTGNSVRCLKNN